MNNSTSFALALTMVFVTSLVGCGKRDAEPEPIRAVRTQTVVAGTAGGTKEYAAEIRARTEARLSFRVGGKLIQRPAEVGRAVKAGQVLAQLDPDDLRQGQEGARAGVTAAEANLELASAEFKRYKELRDQGFISSLELDRRGMALKAAQAQVDQAKSLANVQRNQAAYTTLVASAAGVVTGVDAEVGAVLAAGTPVVRLALDGARDVVFAVPEDAVAALKTLIGKPDALSVRLWGGTGVNAATLREVAASADPVTRTFQAKADLGEAKVQLGQTATVLIDIPRVEGIVKLPLSAITRQQDKSAVWIVDKASMSVKSTPVVVAGADGNEVIIASGLVAGQEVVIAGVHVLTPGQKVKFFSAAQPSAAGVALDAAAAKP
jgi:membrane fusion protein, multidrug efflux system